MDEQMIRAAMRGGRAAQAAALRELQDVWFRLCLALLGNKERAREAVQECALRLLKDWGRFRAESSFRTWAIGIAVNVVREIKRERVMKPWSGQEVASEDGADVQVEREEIQTVVGTALAGLPERQREAVVLRFFEQLSVEETAQAMGCAPGTVRATVFAALRAMKQKLMRIGVR